MAESRTQKADPAVQSRAVFFPVFIRELHIPPPISLFTLKPTSSCVSGLLPMYCQRIPNLWMLPTTPTPVLNHLEEGKPRPQPVSLQKGFQIKQRQDLAPEESHFVLSGITEQHLVALLGSTDYITRTQQGSSAKHLSIS